MQQQQWNHLHQKSILADRCASASGSSTQWAIILSWSGAAEAVVRTLKVQQQMQTNASSSCTFPSNHGGNDVLIVIINGLNGVGRMAYGVVGMIQEVKWDGWGASGADVRRVKVTSVKIWRQTEVPWYASAGNTILHPRDNEEGFKNWLLKRQWLIHRWLKCKGLLFTNKNSRAIYLIQWHWIGPTNNW